MADERFENDANRGESEREPEALLFLELDPAGRNDNRRWRYAARELDGLPYVGPGMWKQIGPAPLQVGGQQIFMGIGPNSGEVVDIAIDPRGDRNVIYIAAGNGGVWKTSDGGASWAPLTEQLAALAIGAIALDPAAPDTIYVGTGNLFDGSAGMPKSNGLLKSVDGGQSWSRLVTPKGRPPQAITAATVVQKRIRVTVAGHGYSTLDRVAVTGLPLKNPLANESVATRIDDNTLDIVGDLASPYAGAGATLFDARQPPFLSDRGVIRMVCPAADALLVATQTGLFYSRDGGRNFGANSPAFDDGKPIRTGFISSLELEQGASRTVDITGASQASPIVVTATAHGFLNGDFVYVGGVQNNTNANGGWLVDRVDDNSFSLRGSNGNAVAGAGGFALGPAHPATHQIQGATNPAAPQPIVITSAGHGFVTGDIVAISGVQGNTAANGSWPIRVLTDNTLALVGSRGNGAYLANSGTIDGPTHPAPMNITDAVNRGGGIDVTVANHGLVNGDRVMLTGLPGVTAGSNTGAVHVIGPNQVRVAGLTMNAVHGGGAGATLAGPADCWNTAYFVSAGRDFRAATLNSQRGLFRLTITSTNALVISDNLLAHAGGVPGAFGRVVVAQSMLPRTNTLYAAVQDRENAAIFIGLFRSTDFGGTWTQRPALANRVAIDGTGQSNYDLTLAVDPLQPNLVYSAFQQLWRSDDGGVTFPAPRPLTRGGMDDLDGGFGLSPSTTLLHWDHHELVFQPPTLWAGGQRPPFVPMYLGTDGGIALGTTLPAIAQVRPQPVMQFQALNEGIATSLLRDLDIGRGIGTEAPSFAGMQDTGSAGHRQGDAATMWNEGIDGDGADVAVDTFDPDIVFGFDNGGLIRSTNGGLTWLLSGFPSRPQILQVFNENPVRVLTDGHSFVNGDHVTISGVTGGGGIANGTHAITVVNKNEIRLTGVNGQGAAAFGTGPTATGDRYLGQASIKDATSTAPIEVETASAHGCADGQRVRIDGVQGNIAANNSVAHPSWTVTVLSPTRLRLTGSDGTQSPAYVSGSGRLRGPAVNGQVTVFRAENTNPVVINALAHGFVSGDQVTVAGVLGNTNANVNNTVIEVLDTNSFTLVGVAGNASFTGGPRLVGLNVGRGLPGQADRTHVALVPKAGAPSSTVYVGADAALFRSDDGGVTFTQVNGFSDPITALHAPADDRLWVGTAGRSGKSFRPGRVLFSTDKGRHFLGTADNFVTDIGAQGVIASIIEDPKVAAGTRVAVVVAGYSGIGAPRRSRHCFVTETGGKSTGGATAWRELGGTYNTAQGNLPDLPVLSVAFDNSDAAAATSALLVASDLGVLRLPPGSTGWERVGPNLPAVSCQALVVDTSAGGNHVTRVGTHGRSAWELTVPTGASIYVEADLGFGEQEQNTQSTRPMVVHSVGDGPLTVTNITGTTADVTVTDSAGNALVFPLQLASGEHRSLKVTFAPSATGDLSTTVGVAANDPASPITRVKVTGIGVAAGRPTLSVRALVEFGHVQVGLPGQIPVEIRNMGTAQLQVDAVDLPAGGVFTITNPPALPLTIAPGGSSTVIVQCAPIATGSVNASMVVRGGGQGQVVNLTGTGITTTAGLIAQLLQFLGLADPDNALL